MTLVRGVTPCIQMDQIVLCKEEGVRLVYIVDHFHGHKSNVREIDFPFAPLCEAAKGEADLPRVCTSNLTFTFRASADMHPSLPRAPVSVQPSMAQSV